MEEPVSVKHRGDPRVVARRLANKADQLAQQLEQLQLENEQLRIRLEVSQYCYLFTLQMLEQLKQHAQTPATSAATEALLALEEDVFLLQPDMPGGVNVDWLKIVPQDLPTPVRLTDADVSRLRSTRTSLVFSLDPAQTLAHQLSKMDPAQLPDACQPAAILQRTKELHHDVKLLMLPRVFATTPEEVAATDAALLQRMSRDAHLDVLATTQAPEALVQLGCYNMETCVAEEPSLQHQQALLEHLQLLPWQVEQILSLVEVFRAICNPQLQLRLQLSEALINSKGFLSLGLEDTATSTSTKSSTQDTGAAAAAASRRAAAGNHHAAAHASSARPADPASQQQRPSGSGKPPASEIELTQQLEFLMRKLVWLEYMYSHLIGCTLDVLQMASMMVYSHPYPSRPSAWAAVLYEQHRGSTQQKQGVAVGSVAASSAQQRAQQPLASAQAGNAPMVEMSMRRTSPAAAGGQPEAAADVVALATCNRTQPQLQPGASACDTQHPTPAAAAGRLPGGVGDMAAAGGMDRPLAHTSSTAMGQLPGGATLPTYQTPHAPTASLPAQQAPIPGCSVPRVLAQAIQQQLVGGEAGAFLPPPIQQCGVSVEELLSVIACQDD